MKKYNTLSELMIDYRNHHNLSQNDLADLLDVDVRTIGRWERSVSLLKLDKEKDFVEKLFIPHQVIRNLNSEHPIPVYYDMQNRSYSLSPMLTKIGSAEWFKSDLPTDDILIHTISSDEDYQNVINYRAKTNQAKPIKKEVIKAAAKYLPEINLISYNQTGFYAGHLCVLPLKYESYLKVKDKEIDETHLYTNDLTGHFVEDIKVFYFYSIDADSLSSALALMKRFVEYFKEKRFENYLFAGITNRENQIELLQEMGLQIIWEDKPESENQRQVLLEGNLDKFLFG